MPDPKNGETLCRHGITPFECKICFPPEEQMVEFIAEGDIKVLMPISAVIFHAKESGRREGASEMLRSIRAALQEIPLTGCDIEIAKSVELHKAAARRDGMEEAARLKCKHCRLDGDKPTPMLYFGTFQHRNGICDAAEIWTALALK